MRERTCRPDPGRGRTPGRRRRKVGRGHQDRQDGGKTAHSAGLLSRLRKRSPMATYAVAPAIPTGAAEANRGSRAGGIPQTNCAVLSRPHGVAEVSCAEMLQFMSRTTPTTLAGLHAGRAMGTWVMRPPLGTRPTGRPPTKHAASISSSLELRQILPSCPAFAF